MDNPENYRLPPSREQVYDEDSAESDYEEDVFKSKRRLRKAQLPKLPSPRELRLPYVERSPVKQQKQIVSISSLNPFFEEFDTYSSESSSGGEKLVNSDLREQHDLINTHDDLIKVCQRKKSTPSLVKWSALGSSKFPGLPPVKNKSQEDSPSSSGADSGKCKSDASAANSNKSKTSSTDDQWEQNDKSNSSIRSKLKNVSKRVKKQLSATGGFVREKLLRQQSFSSRTSIYTNESDNPPSNQISEESLYHEGVRGGHNDVNKGSLGEIIFNYRVIAENSRGSLPASQNVHQESDPTTNMGGLVLNLPNWVENSVTFDEGVNQLEEVIEDEKQRLAQARPMEWAEAVEYLKKSVGRDFRRGFLAISEKMHLQNLQAVRCLKFNNSHSFLAIGGEEGSLVLLDLDYEKPLHYHDSRSDENLHDVWYHVPLGNKCRIQMNQTLVGHIYDIRCVAWNAINGKLLTVDERGVMIVWGFGSNSCWVEEMVNDRSTSMIRDVAWSPDGRRIVVGYEDYDEDGSVTGGVLVAQADGFQLFDRKFPDLQIQFVLWYNDSIVWAVVNDTIYAFNGKGELGKTFCSLLLNGQPSEITSLLLKPKSSWATSERTPDLVVVYKENCLAMYNSNEDKAPLRVHIQLTPTCSDWSANGLYIVIGGVTSASINGQECSYPQINLYNYEGKLLQLLKIPEETITSVSWDHDSLHLAIAAGRQIFFASLTPMYKVCRNQAGTHCYAYTKDCVNQFISFWAPGNLFTERIPGKVIDVKCFKDRFALLCMDSMGVYHVLVFGETGVYQQHLCIVTMEPFALTITKTSVICLALNAVLNWNYNLGSSASSSKFSGALKTTRQVHVDDFPGIIAKPGEKGDHLLRSTSDCARCLHALGDRLCIARESGKLQLYALPTLGFLQTYQIDLDGDICQQISFNKDGSQLALLTMNGYLRICVFPQAGERYMGIISCNNLTSVSMFHWASDVSHQICVLEGNNLHVLSNGQIETISNVPNGCYITGFEALYVTLINMDKVIESPDCPSSSEMIIKLATPTLSKVQQALENDEEMLEDIVNAISGSNEHTLLRTIVAQEALRQGEYEMAQTLYHENKDYASIQFLQKLMSTQDESMELQKARVHCCLSDFEQAQHYFLRAGRKDLAIKMWKELEDWEKVTFLTGHSNEEASEEALESQSEKLIESQEWELALEICGKVGNVEALVDCCVMLEDYATLIALSEKLPLKDPILRRIGEILHSVGLIEAAAECFVAFGNPAAAMEITVDTQHWDLSISLSHQFKLPVIAPALVKHIRSLITSGRVSSAVQALERCGKILTAGKLLVWKGLIMLQSELANTLEVKKVFVLAAKMLSASQIRGKRNSGTSLRNCPNETEELDLEFLIPEEHLKMMVRHNEWCWTDPWRGAEGIQFLNLAQRFLYSGMMGRALKAVMHLRNFEDILGSERINSLVAITAMHNNYYKIASNALLKLESIDEAYAEISCDLFGEHPPEDHDVTKSQCPSCKRHIPDFFSECPLCGLKFNVCIYSGCPILQDTNMWTCKVCCRHVEFTKTDRFEYCLLCHSEK